MKRNYPAFLLLFVSLVYTFYRSFGAAEQMDWRFYAFCCSGIIFSILFILLCGEIRKRLQD